MRFPPLHAPRHLYADYNPVWTAVVAARSLPNMREPTSVRHLRQLRLGGLCRVDLYPDSP
jgi:hypothetical protein